MALLIAVLIAVPILELWVIIEVGGWIGVLPTLALLFGFSLLGAVLLRHEGRGAWLRFNRALGERRFPGREVADGLLITIGGVLLLVPGFITDAAGLLLLLPPTRAIGRRLLRTYAGRRFVLVDIGGMRGRPDTNARRAYDHEGTAEDIDEESRRLDP